MNDDRECYIEYKHYGTTIRFSGLDRGMPMEDFHDLCQRLALAIGYQPETVGEWFENE
jgi:hypothetical protein